MNQKTDTAAAPKQIPPCSPAKYVDARGFVPSRKPQSAADIDLSEFRPNEQNVTHRGPYEAGAANRYYGRPYMPNFCYYGITYCEAEMTSEQKELYRRGWNEEKGEKQW